MIVSRTENRLKRKTFLSASNHDMKKLAADIRKLPEWNNGRLDGKLTGMIYNVGKSCDIILAEIDKMVELGEESEMHLFFRTEINSLQEKATHLLEEIKRRVNSAMKER